MGALVISAPSIILFVLHAQLETVQVLSHGPILFKLTLHMEKPTFDMDHVHVFGAGNMVGPDTRSRQFLKYPSARRIINVHTFYLLPYPKR